MNFDQLLILYWKMIINPAIEYQEMGKHFGDRKSRAGLVLGKAALQTAVTVTLAILQ